MAVFISYSHQDAEFAVTLATNLIKEKAHVWIDRWELRVGDSLIQRIQDAIDKASALVVVLSHASVNSEWCQKELSVGLLRELDERKVLVLPVLIDDCKIPLFLRDKKFADFRSDFDSGLRDVREAIARITNESLGRLENPEWHIDWATNWGIDDDGLVTVNLTMVEQAVDQPYCVLSTVSVLLNPLSSARHLMLIDAGLEAYARQSVLQKVAETDELSEVTVILQDAEPIKLLKVVDESSTGFGYAIMIECRRLGEDTGRDIRLRVGNQIIGAVEQSRRTMRPPDPSETARAQTILDISENLSSPEDAVEPDA